jgi:hypothetical protein
VFLILALDNDVILGVPLIFCLLLFHNGSNNSNKTIGLSEKIDTCNIFVILITLMFEHDLKRSHLNEMLKDKETFKFCAFCADLYHCHIWEIIT